MTGGVRTEIFCHVRIYFTKVIAFILEESTYTQSFVCTFVPRRGNAHVQMRESREMQLHSYF